jgi:hypothetical protein
LPVTPRARYDRHQPNRAASALTQRRGATASRRGARNAQPGAGTGAPGVPGCVIGAAPLACRSSRQPTAAQRRDQQRQGLTTCFTAMARRPRRCALTRRQMSNAREEQRPCRSQCLNIWMATWVDHSLVLSGGAFGCVRGVALLYFAAVHQLERVADWDNCWSIFNTPHREVHGGQECHRALRYVLSL